MDKKFTPGKWSVAMPTNKRSCFAKINAEHWGSLAIVVVRMKADDTCTETHAGEANARLIAHAPEMYDQLQWAIDTKEFVREFPVSAARIKELLKRINQ